MARLYRGDHDRSATCWRELLSVGGLAPTRRVDGYATLALIACWRGDVADVAGPLLERWLRLAAWPQLWTSLRVLAELFAARGRDETAALLLAAAAQVPSAPAVTGADAKRYRRLHDVLQDRVGPQVHGGISELAALLPRSHVVDRARVAVAELGPTLRGGTFKEVLNDALRAGLSRLESPAPSRPTSFTRPVSLGRPALPDVDDVAEVLVLVENDTYR
ncbi:hypothetical protein [Pseudonocardia asaccharolytica]|uniref:Uncharacterized protein n=1 Tax=Pseudonocardia asaccharolytica DSM 44247 = NBRC 16224 TaxID=1123024 RepID=A0A511D0A9_9PSEU|nr:hypothetical protein [Pseudonocardia asaccharolytica]GEL17963.1 hypothetical protein PA7_18000 [Pseudonocardia asaccharolytica DSM 44247 = NBRC 16224]